MKLFPSNEVLNDDTSPPTKLRKLENRLQQASEEKEYYRQRSAKNRQDKNSLKLAQQIQSRVQKTKNKARENIARNKLVSIHERKVKALKEQVEKYHGALQKIFTHKQITLLTSGQHHVKWTNEDIGRFITMRYKSNMYEFMRSQGFPFACTRTLQRFTNKIDFRPGLLFPIINLLKNEFQDAPEIMRQCVLSFDEMSLEGSYAYDSKEDKIYSPSTNINAYFVRGIHDSWKQMIAYELDDSFHPQNILQMISILEVIGLRVRGMTCDFGGKNRGLLNKLGVQVRKLPSANGESHFSVSSSFTNPSRPEEKIWVFPDAPHMLKLIRDNLFKHGFVIEDGHLLTKSDFEKLIEVDSAEMQSNHKLGRKHLDVKGLQKTTVSLAVQLFSNTTAALWRKVYPNRSKQAEFIQICNDWFDVMNARTLQEAQQLKAPFGLHYQQQLDILNKMEHSILKLRVGSAKFLYPFQRGILESIHSLKGLYHDLSGSSMRISYILTHRLNQDLIENAFSVVRKTGAFHTKPSVVDAKQRFKLLCLSMGGNMLTTSAVQEEDNQPLLSARMMGSLVNVSATEYPPTPEPLFSVPEEIPIVNTLTLENVDVVLRSMGTEQSCESGGKEWVSGYVASKFNRKYPDLVASHQEKQALQQLSWVINLDKGGLTIPSLAWRNQCAVLEAEFDHYHSVGGTHQLNLQHGALKGLTATLISKYPNIPQEPLSLFIRTKMFIRIKAANAKLKEQRRDAAQRRWGRVPDEEERDQDEDINDEEEEMRGYENGEGEQLMGVTNHLDWQTIYQNYLDGTV